VAIEALKIGATDYVLKSGLSRLAPSVKRALREAGDRAQRKLAEEALRRSEMYLAEAQALSHTGSFGWEILSGENLLVRRNLSHIRDRADDQAHGAVGARPNPSGRPGVSAASHRAGHTRKV
jgi:hypothetical protein